MVMPNRALTFLRATCVGPPTQHVARACHFPFSTTAHAHIPWVPHATL